MIIKNKSVKPVKQVTQAGPYEPPGADQVPFLRTSLLYCLCWIAVDFICCVAKGRSHSIWGCLLHVLKVQNKEEKE